MIKSYCLGLIFDSGLNNILLIEKNKPEWQKGRLNGIGGKVELGEDGLAAMVRETHEETGLIIPASVWRHTMDLSGNDWHMEVFVTQYEDLYEAKQMEEESLHICAVNSVSVLNCIANLKWIVPYSKLKLSGYMDQEFIVLDQGKL